jgi:hypothetical protein
VLLQADDDGSTGRVSAWGFRSEGERRGLGRPAEGGWDRGQRGGADARRGGRTRGVERKKRRTNFDLKLILFSSRDTINFHYEVQTK